MEEIRYYIKVCEKCGRQVSPHVDHNLGPSRWVPCNHGFKGLGTMESVGWKKVEVVLLDAEFDPPVQCPAVYDGDDRERRCTQMIDHNGEHKTVRGPCDIVEWG